MRNDDSRPDPAAPVDLRPTPKMPLKRECTARGGVGYADDTTLSSTMVGGTAENTGIPMPTTAASAGAIECKDGTLQPAGNGPTGFVAGSGNLDTVLASVDPYSMATVPAGRVTLTDAALTYAGTPTLTTIADTATSATAAERNNDLPKPVSNGARINPDSLSALIELLQLAHADSKAAVNGG